MSIDLHPWPSPPGTSGCRVSRARIVGGGIGGRADHDSWRGDAGCVEEVCDAEVHESRPERDDSVPDRAQQHVRRLDIAVDDAGVVDDRRRAGETDDERDDLVTGQRVLRKTVVKRLPRHELQCRPPSNMRRIRLASPRMPPRMRGETILLGLLYAAGAALAALILVGLLYVFTWGLFKA